MSEGNAAVERLREIAHRDEAKVVSVRADDLRALLTTSDETARLRGIISDGADMLDMMIAAWVESREVSDDEGKRATIALFSMNAALQSQEPK